jgi:hypothetical protein
VCPPPTTESAASYLNTSYKFFVLAKVWREKPSLEKRDFEMAIHAISTERGAEHS